MAKEYIIYCDESTKEGRYYSNFYGGALVSSKDLEEVIKILNQKKMALNLRGEVKFQKITQNYAEKYKELMDVFFELVKRNQIKIRIMFSQNRNVPVNLDQYQNEHGYFLLYYQFIKNAFGLRYANDGASDIAVRLYLDQLPDTKEKAHRFKDHIANLSNQKQFQQAGIFFPKDQIAEIRSHDHVILQCLDVVLGSMQFRLNDCHKDKPEGQYFRSKRTVAKEQVYKHIRSHIGEIVSPNFNIGVSTGRNNDVNSLWSSPYRHWLFKPQEHRIDDKLTK